MFSNKKALLFNWDGAVSKALLKEFPSVKKRSDKKSLRSLMSSNAGFELKEYFQQNPQDFDKIYTLVNSYQMILINILKADLMLTRCFRKR